MTSFSSNSCNVECQDSCHTSSWSEWSTCKPRHCNENYKIDDSGGGIGYQKPSIPGKQNVSQLESVNTILKWIGRFSNTIRFIWGMWKVADMHIHIIRTTFINKNEFESNLLRLMGGDDECYTIVNLTTTAKQTWNEIVISFSNVYTLYKHCNRI